MTHRLVQDPLGRDLEVPAHPRRIVSLSPALTDLLFDLGVGERVVGVTRDADAPDAALPRVGGAKNPAGAAIAQLAPDLVLALKDENLERDVSRLASAGLTVYVAEVESVEDAVGLVGELGDLVDAAAPRVEALADAARRGIREARAFAAARRPPLTFCPVRRDPWTAPAHGTYLHDLLELCGARPIHVTDGETRDRRFPKVELAALTAAPALILLPDHPHPFTPADAAELATRFPGARIVPCPGRALHRYGHHLAALPLVARWVHGAAPTAAAHPG